MALVLGVNCGFVETAPTADPDAIASTSGDRCIGTRHTSPAGAIKITEIGWYQSNATPEANFEVGIYTHDGGDDEPQTVVGSLSTENAKGTSGGWHRVTGLDITISSSTIYWICLQIDYNTVNTSVDVATSGGDSRIRSGPEYYFALPDPTWDIEGSVFSGQMHAIYAVVEEAATGVTRKIKISGTFQDKPIKTKVSGTFVDKVTKIKVGGTFQDA